MPTDCWKARAKWFGESPATEDMASRLIFSPMCSSMNSQMRFFSTGARPPRLKSDASGMGMLLNMLKRGLEWTIASCAFRDRLVRASGGVSNARHESCAWSASENGNVLSAALAEQVGTKFEERG